MEPKISFNTPKVPRLNLFIPQAVIAGNMIFVSGMAGMDPDTGKLISTKSKPGRHSIIFKPL